MSSRHKDFIMGSKQISRVVALPCVMLLTAIVSSVAQCPATVLTCTCTFPGNVLSTITCAGLNEEGIPHFEATDQRVSTVEIKDSMIYKLQATAFQGIKMRNLLLNNLKIQLIEDGALKGLEGFLESIELRGNEFTVLPDNFLFNFTQLTTLSLDNNRLAFIKTNWFTNLESLQYLSFSKNEISAIQAGSFDSTPNVEKLYLSGNKLNYLDENVFAPLNSLTELGLADNLLSAVPRNLLVTLKKLRWLDLTKNTLETIPEGFFEKSNSLSELFLGSNRLREIKSTQLPASNSLKTLSLSNNNISMLWDSTFQNVRELKSLLLDHNNIGSIPELGFEYLEHLEVLDLKENVISELPVNNLVGLLALKNLNLAGNEIKVLTYGIFDPLGLLTFLDLSRNKLSEIQFGPFDALRKLVHLDLRRNDLKGVEDHWFRHAVSLETLHMEYNKIRSIESKSFVKLTELNFLSLDHNYVTSFDRKLFSTNKELRTLSISHNPLQDVHLETFGQLKKLKTLHLNYTCMNSIPNGIFKNLSLLDELHFDHSPIETIDVYSFSGLSKLKILSLGYHNITSIASRSFSVFNDIQKLGLENMGLKAEDLTDILYDLPKLKELSLAYNLIEYVDKATFRFNPVLEHLNLVGNPIKCECRVAWLRENNTIVIERERTTCSAPSNNEKLLLLCFPLSRICNNIEMDPSLDQICSGGIIGVGMAMATNQTSEEGPSLNFDHCIVPPEPTSTVPGIVTTSPVTTLSPIVIKVRLFDNDTKISVTWGKHENSAVLAYRVRYRQFATNVTRTSADLPLNETFHVIEDFQAGMNYIVCIDIKTASNQYIRHDASCEEIGSQLSGTNGGEVTTAGPKKELPWIPIVGASAAALVVIFIIIIAIVFSLRNAKTRFTENAKKKEDRDRMVKDKMGMWVNSFNYDGNVHESMGEQLTLEFDIFSGSKQDINSMEPGVVASETKNGLKNIGYEPDVPRTTISGDSPTDMSSDPGYAEPSESVSDAGFGEVTENENAFEELHQNGNNHENNNYENIYENQGIINETYMY